MRIPQCLGRGAGLAALHGLVLASLAGTADTTLEFTARRRVPVTTNTELHRVQPVPLRWEARRTAAVVCDMWNRHWCGGATARVAEMAPRMNDLLGSLRKRGVLIIHCPSETLKFYEGTEPRARARQAPKVEPKVPVRGWCGRDPQREPPLPIDDSDGGCDDDPPCAQGQPWTRQIESIAIEPADAISDSAEVLNLMAQQGIDHVLIMGVHLNMCVLGRPFGIRQLVGQGKEVVLVRDLTDTMYNPRRRPQVDHATGTDLMIQHVESYWCASVTSADLMQGPALRFSSDIRPRAVVLIGEDEYQTWDTLPRFVAADLQTRNLAVTVLHESPADPGRFPLLESEVGPADVVLLSLRRRALPPEQLETLRRHLEAGRGLVALRTTSHGFAPRGNAPAPGRSHWPEFDADVLGGNYRGHHGAGPVTLVSVAPGAAGHVLLAGLDPGEWRSTSSLYRTSPLRAGTELLLTGAVPGQPAEPLAWTRRHGTRQARIFYTSLGNPADFEQPAFRRLLVNALTWAAARNP